MLMDPARFQIHLNDGRLKDQIGIAKWRFEPLRRLCNHRVAGLSRGLFAGLGKGKPTRKRQSCRDGPTKPYA